MDKEKIEELKQQRFLNACLKIDPEEEIALAEEGMSEELKYWPEY